MIYKFKSPATGDLIMLGPHGDQVLRLLGREPSAKGIIEAAAMPDAIAALQAAIVAEEALRKADREGAGAQEPADDAPRASAVVLRQRLWPMIDMLRRAQQAGEPVVWGV